MLELLAHARRIGVSVHVAHLPPPYRGFYDADRRRVIYDFNLTPAERLEVLAHELGHAFHDHRCRQNAEAELQADIYAAELLVDPDTLARLERISSDPEAIADEMGLTVRVIETYWRHCITRLRGVSYARSRMGIGQWSARVAHA